MNKKRVVIRTLLFTVLACLIGFSNAYSQTMAPEKKYVVIAYYMGARGQKISVSDVKKMTHINYAFADVVNGEVVEIHKEDAKYINEVVDLKKHNPDLKILISIGGWSRSKGFSDAVLSKEARERFANSCIAFMQRHKLDGVDLDWEYPGQKGDNNKFRPEDTQNFTLALALIRKKLDALEKKENKHYLLTIATGANQSYLDHVEMPKIHQYLDLINIMTYDFHGAYNRITGHHTNLFASETDPDLKKRNAADAVNEHIQAGAPVEKLVIGAAFYGKGWKEVENVRNGLHAKAEGQGFTIPYKDIAESLSKGSYKRFWDSKARTPYAWNKKEHIFIGYDDEESIAEKAKFVKEKGMAGAMYWEYSGDKDGLLLGAMYNVFNPQE